MTDISTRQFISAILILSFIYLGFEYWFNQYAMISVDEFWFAHRIFQYRDQLPYRDFSPYKTVLGYYFLVLPLTLSHGIINTLVFTKNCIATLNILIVTSGALWLTRFFSRSGTALAFLLLISMEIMLSFSSNIRVDLLAYWFCLFSLLCLLDKRFMIAGLLIGLGFATSQKAIWYWFASNAALGFTWLISERNRSFFYACTKFNLAAASVVAAYLTLWSVIAGWETIYQNVFVEASAMYHLDWYDSSRQLYWGVILTLNPLAFLLAPFTVISLFITYPEDRHYSNRRFAIIYVLTILACLLPYKQVFPYYMQVTLPAFLVLYAAFFTWLIGFYQTRQPIYLVKQAYISLFNAAISLTILTLVFSLHLPYAYLLMSAMPLVLRTGSAKLFILNLVFIGLVYPGIIYTKKLKGLDGHYQKENLTTIDTLLKDKSSYVAGIELIYNQTQPVPGLRHLMGPAIDYLYQPTTKLRSVMTSALYEDPEATTVSVIQALKTAKVKFYVNNYRINALPPDIKNYFSEQYQHWWGSIYIYAPFISSGAQTTTLKFKGEYELQTEDQRAVTINHQTYQNGDHLILNTEPLPTEAAHAFRLVMVPDRSLLSLNPAFKADDWQKMLF